MQEKWKLLKQHMIGGIYLDQDTIIVLQFDGTLQQHPTYTSSNVSILVYWPTWSNKTQIHPSSSWKGMHNSHWLWGTLSLTQLIMIYYMNLLLMCCTLIIQKGWSQGLLSCKTNHHCNCCKQTGWDGCKKTTTIELSLTTLLTLA